MIVDVTYHHFGQVLIDSEVEEGKKHNKEVMRERESVIELEKVKNVLVEEDNV